MESCLQERACPPTQEGERDGIASSLETLYTNPLPMRLRKRGLHTARSFTFWRATEKGKGQKGTPFQQNSAYMADPVKLMTMSIRFWLGRLKARLPKIWGWMLLHGAGLPGRSYGFLCLKGEGQGKPMGKHAHGYKPTPSGIIDRRPSEHARRGPRQSSGIKTAHVSAISVLLLPCWVCQRKL